MNALKETVSKYWLEFLMLMPVFVYLLGFLIVIFYYLVYLSLTQVMPDYSTHFPSLCNFISILDSSDFKTAFLHTVIFVVVGTPLELIAGLVLALIIYKDFRFRGIVRSIFVIPLAMPAIVTAFILIVLFEYPNGHVNTLLLGKHSFVPQMMVSPINWRESTLFALGISLLGKVWRDMPISMLILLAGLNSISQDQYRAAETLGAGSRQKFRYITLPLLLPSISTVLVIRSIEMWKEFIFPYFLARRYHLMGTLIESLYHDWDRKGEAAAVSIILVACIVAFAAFLFWVLKKTRTLLIRV